MNKKGFLDLDMELDGETMMAAIFGIICGFIALIVAKQSAVGVFYKIMTFVVSTIAGFFLSRFIFSR